MASIIESLAIVLGVDAEEALKELKRVINGVEETENALDNAGKATDRFKGSLLGTFTALAGGITALFSAGAALSGITSAIDYADQIGEAAEALGVSTENLSAWTDAAKEAGGSAEGLQSSVKNLSKDLYQFAETGKSRAAPFLKSFGIAMKDANGAARDVFDVLPDIAQAMEGMSKQEAIGFGQKIGLDSGTIMLLQQGKAGLEEVIKRQKDLGVVTKEDAETAAKFKDALDNTGKALRPIFLGIANFILPAFTWMNEKIQKATGYVKEHSFFFKIAVMGMATAITMYLLPALYKSAAAMLANPLTWIIGGILLLIGLIALIAEDIYMFSTGGESLIGKLAKKWQWFGDTVEFLGKLFKALFRDVKTVIGFFTDMWNNPEQALEDFKLVLSSLWNDFIDSVPGLRSVLDVIVAIFNKAIGGIKATIEATTNAITTAKDLLTGSNSAEEKALKAYNDADTAKGRAESKRRYQEWEASLSPEERLKMMQARTPQIQQMASSNIANTNNQSSKSSNSVVTNNVTVNASGDPKQIGEEVEKKLSELSKTAIQQTDDGVSH